MLDALGWIATGVFTTSYFARNQASLRRIQAAAACLWIVYGLAIGALPVVAANVMVGIAAIASSFRSIPRDRRVSVTGASVNEHSLAATSVIQPAHSDPQ